MTETPRLKFECPKGHKTTSAFRLYVDGEVINRACERCFGEWMEKTFPTKEVE